MDFEHGFADAERAAQAVERAAKDLLKAAKQMEKSAQEGDIKKLRKAAATITTAADVAKQSSVNAQAAWPFSEPGEHEYLEHQFSDEFLATARSIGLTAYRSDDRLVAFPSILRILPADRAFKIDRNRTVSLRPSYLAKLLLENQKKGPRSKAEHFLEALYVAYKLLVPKADRGIAIKLADVYEAFTLQPGAKQEYGRSEFTRDIYMLAVSPVRTTKSGAVVDLQASTSARGAERDKFPFVAPNGEVQMYYAVKFKVGDA